MESLGTDARMKRPEGAEAPSPGQRPGLLRTQTCRPVRAKAFTPETSFFQKWDQTPDFGLKSLILVSFYF